MALIVFKNIIVVFILYIHVNKKITSGSSSSFGDLKKKKKQLYFLYFIENIVLLMFPNATEKLHFLK